MKKKLLLIIALLFSIFCFSQELKPNRTEINNFYNAEAYIYEGNYEKALDLLLQLENINPNNPNIKYKIGLCYLNTRLFKKEALSYLQEAAKHTSPSYKENSHKEKSAPLETFLYLGMAYRVNYMFDESLKAFQELKNMLSPSKPEDKILLKLVDREIEITKTAIDNVNNPINAKLQNLGSTINSEFADHSPIIDLNENYLIFTSKRPRDGQALKNQDEDIFISKNVDGKWQSPTRLGEPINTATHNEAAIGLSIDGKQLFFYRSGENNTGSVYISESEDMYNWSIPQLLKEDVNSRFKETHTSITPDGNSIFFTSNRKGGFGGLDIYVMRKLPNGKWSEPKILSKDINTEYDEESPYIHPDGITLFFSSKGHNSMGGYDVFSSTMYKNGKFTTPINLGYPINTPDDDVAYIMNLTGQKGYIASLKDNGYGDLDLYEILQEGVYENNMIIFEGFVKNENNTIPENVTITIKQKDSDDKYEISRLNKSNGKYSVMMLPNNTYEIYYEAKGHLTNKIEITPTNNTLKSYSSDYNPIELETVVLKSLANHDYVYFNKKSSQLDDQTIAILDKVSTKHNELKSKNEKLFISFTLPKFDSDPNVDAERINNISNYLTLKGIERKNILTDNSSSDELSAVYVLEIVENAELLIATISDEVSNDKAIVQIDNILFDFDKYIIKDEYFANLDILAKYLNDNPNAKIEIGGHTDWLGSGEYNYLLSYHRSKAVKDYLVNKGNNAENIITTKYGKDQPIAANQTLDGRDNPTGRKYNRRAEFKVLNQGSKANLEINPIVISEDEAYEISKIPSSKKFTIQIYALKNQKPVEDFPELIGVKLHVSEDGWYRYYVGEYTSYRMAVQAEENLKSQGFDTLIRKLNFFEE